MKAEPVTVRRLGIGVAVVVALATSGCAAGQVAATANQKAVEAGTEADAGAIAIRGLLIEPPSGATPYYASGDSATVRLVLVNSGSKADRLTGITSTAFTSWGAYASSADASAVATAPSSTASSSAAASSTSAGASSSAAAGSSSPAGSSTSASPSATAPPLPTPSTSVALAPGNRVSWGVPEAKGALLLMHLKHRVYPGSTMVLTLTFANAGSVTVRVPVAVLTAPSRSVIPAPTSEGEG